MAAFEPKAFLDILAGMIAAARAGTDRITDYNVGSVTRTWLEAAALALDELYLGTATGILAAIPEAVYLAFGFERLPATYALGEVTFRLGAAAAADTTILAGTFVRTLGAELTFITLQAGTIPAGALEVTVPARATTVGQAGNVDAGELTVIVGGAPPGLTATNRAPIQTGSEEETDAERQARFAQFILALARGTPASLRYAARMAAIVVDGTVQERVAHAALVEAPGSVRLYVHNGAGRTSAALLAEVERLIEGDDATPGWRAAGVEVSYYPMADTPLVVSGAARLAAGYAADAVEAAARAALAALCRSFTGDFLSVPAIRSALYSVPGLLDLVLEEPAAGIEIGVAERPVFGALTLEWGE